jgi:predicted nucleic acid-binding protein
VPIVFRLPRDPNDEPILNLAIAAGATHLVTWNHRHLGYLMEGDTREGRDFCRRFRKLQIVNPKQFIDEIDRGR